MVSGVTGIPDETLVTRRTQSKVSAVPVSPHRRPHPLFHQQPALPRPSGTSVWVGAQGLCFSGCHDLSWFPE